MGWAGNGWPMRAHHVLRVVSCHAFFFLLISGLASRAHACRANTYHAQEKARQAFFFKKGFQACMPSCWRTFLSLCIFFLGQCAFTQIQ